MRPGRLAKPCLNVLRWAFWYCPPGCDAAVKVTADFACFGLWGLSCRPGGRALSDKQAVTARAFLLFASKGEKSFCTLAYPDYTAQGCVLYGWACNSVCSCHKNLQAVLCTRAAGENDTLFWQKRGLASQDQSVSSLMCDFSHPFNRGVCWGLLEMYGRLTKSRETW